MPLNKQQIEDAYNSIYAAENNNVLKKYKELSTSEIVQALLVILNNNSGNGSSGSGVPGGATALKQDEQTALIESLENQIEQLKALFPSALINNSLRIAGQVEVTNGYFSYSPDTDWTLPVALGQLYSILFALESKLDLHLTNKLMPEGNLRIAFGNTSGECLKNEAGSVHAFTCTHISNSTMFFQIINKNSNPIAGNIPIISFPVSPDNSLLVIGQDILGGSGIECSTGIAWGVSTSRLIYQPANPDECIVSVRWS